jgi:hypothetical protein
VTTPPRFVTAIILKVKIPQKIAAGINTVM